MSAKRKQQQRGRSGNPAKAAWVPMRRAPALNPAFVKTACEVTGESPAAFMARTSVWSNGTYECIARQLDGGMVHLSVKRYDRAAVHNWRVLQAIKNEVVGPEREAADLHPAESRLVDASNEYHLWVLPEGQAFDFGYRDALVSTPEETAEWNADRRAQHAGDKSVGKGQQAPWVTGMPTGPSLAALNRIAAAARVYFREFDHLVGQDYPERAELRDALAALEAQR